MKLRSVLWSVTLTASSVAFGAGGHSAHQQQDAGAVAASVDESALHSTATEGLPEVRPSQTVELKDGDSYTLVASPVKQRIAGKWLRRLAYNGSIPGPLIKARQGATVRITLKNATDAETTLHPHGLRIDDKNDGVVGIGQAAIAPGQSHEYTLTFLDAGVFWYHPHVRDDYTQEMGLYGNFLVMPRSPDFYNPVHRELPLVLDDTGVQGATPFYKHRVTHTLMGRFGDVMLVNGVEDFRLKGTSGEVLRLFVTNTANTRTFALAIPGVRLKLVGGDNGLYERESWVEQVVIAPSERYIVELKLPKPGLYDVVNAKPSGPTTLARLEVEAGTPPPLAGFDELRAPAAAAAELKVVKEKLGIPVQKALRLTLAMDHASLPMKHGAHGAKSGAEGAAAGRGIEWDDDMPEMNRASHDRNVVWKMIDEATRQENMGIDWSFKKGDFVKIRLVNDARSMHPMQHPIHFHGNRFVVAAVDGKPTGNLVWKDSVLIASGETVDIVLEATQPGRWMAHCHIAEHLGAGMMIGFQVKE
jgi:FtsP/CotA-like multicopper oxidase with cupredoxin domain